MRTIQATIPAVPDYRVDREKLTSILAGLHATAAFTRKVLIAIPLFGLVAMIFALHLVFPSEEHW